MTASEFAFLAMGLILGVAAGAALVEIIRARPPAAREVRVTVAPDAVPRRRAATLANDAFTDSAVATQPAHGGPADHRELLAGSDSPGPEPRTPVRLPMPRTVVEPAFRLTGPSASIDDAGSPNAPLRLAAAQAMPISSGIDPMLTALRASAAASAEAAMQLVSPARVAAVAAAPARPAVEAEPAVETQPTVEVLPAVEVQPAVEGRARPSAMADAKRVAPAVKNATAAPPAQAPAEAPSGPCGEARRLADERCELATRARNQADAAEEAHRAAQRAYDDHENATAAAAAQADARALRQAKDDAQARFRAGRSAARTAEGVEAAARQWLLEINDINARARDATAALLRERSAAPEMALRLEGTAVAADGARIAAEAAEAACVGARQALADCEERVAGGRPRPSPASPVDRGDDDGTDSDALAAALRAGASPRIMRLLRGDRTAMHEVVSALGGEDSVARRRWQVAVSDLVDAILADAIAASALEFPTDHPFWGPFSRAQGRDIAAALSSLGYRFDGLGGWVDDRIPSQRDLSLALGYAGLDPMRMRHWPNEAEMSKLFAQVEVAGAEHLADVAGDLTLGELVTMLGRRADGLAEIWNAWGRIRPLLLD